MWTSLIDNGRSHCLACDSHRMAVQAAVLIDNCQRDGRWHVCMFDAWTRSQTEIFTENKKPQILYILALPFRLFIWVCLNKVFMWAVFNKTTAADAPAATFAFARSLEKNWAVSPPLLWTFVRGLQQFACRALSIPLASSHRHTRSS